MNTLAEAKTVWDAVMGRGIDSHRWYWSWCGHERTVEAAFRAWCDATRVSFDQHEAIKAHLAIRGCVRFSQMYDPAIEQARHEVSERYKRSLP